MSASNTAEKRKYPPMLEQYLQYEQQLPDSLIFMQVGDFYELFFDHAVTTAKELNLTLTSRDKNSPNPIPMCGVPVSVIDGYLSRLVDAGHTVAVVSQVGTATTKGMVERKLERVVTPGIRLLAGNDDNGHSGGIASLYLSSSGELAVCTSVVQTGEVVVREGIELSHLVSELERSGPEELILPREIEGRQLSRKLGWVRELEERFSNLKVKFRYFEGVHDRARTSRDFASLSGYGGLSPEAKKAVRILVEYIDEITVDCQIPLRRVLVKSFDQSMSIDAVSRRNLELVRNLRDGTIQGTLLQHLDLTKTLGGRRLLREWLLSPLMKVEELIHRQEAVQFFVEASVIRTELRKMLDMFPDLERIAARIELGIVTPRELAAARDALEKCPELLSLLQSDALLGVPSALARSFGAFNLPPELVELLCTFLVDNPPVTVNEGGIVRAGAHQDVDRLREVRLHGREWIAQLESAERVRTGIQSLKIKFNGVLGYFFEVTKANLEKVPENYVRRQSMVNCERFTTEELKERESELLGAKSNLIALEKKLFEDFRLKVSKYTESLRELYRAISCFDVYAALGELAEKEGYVRPTLDSNTSLKIEAGCHPILAKALRERFIPNSIDLNGEGRNFITLTGANMGGKSTYLRQTALIAIMAQIGSFVPAASAHIGIVDKVFARLGASDDITEGESTFMVEMREAAYILNTATKRSLVLIDEIGRGTATADGLSIARAILEWVVQRINCRTLFATHFHELTALSDSLDSVENWSVGSVEMDGKVSFTHHIVAGPASKSYGIEVAKLAGLPPSVIRRAEQLMQDLTSQSAVQGHAKQISLFDGFTQPNHLAAQTTEADCSELERIRAQLGALEQKLKQIDINETKPIEALRLISELQEIIQ